MLGLRGEVKPCEWGHILSRVSPHERPRFGRVLPATVRDLPIRVVAGLVVGILIIAVGAVVAAPSAYAQVGEGLVVSSDTVYTPQPEASRIDVAATFTLTNVQPDEQIGDRVRSYFFTTWTIALPENAIDFTASSSGRPLRTMIEPNNDSEAYVIGVITLPFELNYQQSVTVQANYAIPSGEPRGAPGLARVNESFFSFPVWVLGDPGETNLRVDVPEGFELDFQGSTTSLVRIQTGNADYFEARDIASPQDFFGRVFGRNDQGLVTETAALESGVATVRAWPDDPEWAALVVDAIENDVPVIEELTGLPWPTGDIEIIETVTPYLFGYAGWYNADTGLIEVGDQLERDIILHELTHVWFNDELIASRWIVEGLAEETAALVIAADSPDRPLPSQPITDDPIAVPLEDWANPFRFSEDEAYVYEQYHYNASWWVIYQLTAEIGVESLDDVLIAIDADEISFVGEGEPETVNFAKDWRYFLDVIEERGGADNAEELFRTYVLNDESALLLDERAVTHERYDELLTKSGTWGPPLVIREDLSRWAFAVVDQQLDIADRALATRAAIEARADALKLSVVQLAEVPYEIADSTAALAEAAATADEQLTTLDELADRRADLTETAETLGLELRFTTMDFEAAVEQANSLSIGLDDLSTRRAELRAAADAIDLALPPWPSTELPGGLTDQQAALTDHLDNVALIATAQARTEQANGLFERVGLFGRDPQRHIDTARDAFTSGDPASTATIRSETAAVDRLVNSASASGRSRLTWTAVTLAVGLFGLLGFRRLGTPNLRAGDDPSVS